MSRGLGSIQRYLMKLIWSSPDPMTFVEIMAVAFPEGSYEFDIAKVVGGSNVGRVRSLRRALQRLCHGGGTTKQADEIPPPHVLPSQAEGHTLPRRR